MISTPSLVASSISCSAAGHLLDREREIRVTSAPFANAVAADVVGGLVDDDVLRTILLVLSR
jgi:hypothetical protein